MKTYFLVDEALLTPLTKVNEIFQWRGVVILQAENKKKALELGQSWFQKTKQVGEIVGKNKIVTEVSLGGKKHKVHYILFEGKTWKE